jgi:hypothetical protein
MKARELDAAATNLISLHLGDDLAHEVHLLEVDLPILKMRWHLLDEREVGQENRCLFEQDGEINLQLHFNLAQPKLLPTAHERCNGRTLEGDERRVDGVKAITVVLVVGRGVEHDFDLLQFGNVLLIDVLWEAKQQTQDQFLAPPLTATTLFMRGGGQVRYPPRGL